MIVRYGRVPAVYEQITDLCGLLVCKYEKNTGKRQEHVGHGRRFHEVELQVRLITQPHAVAAELRRAACDVALSSLLRTLLLQFSELLEIGPVDIS